MAQAKGRAPRYRIRGLTVVYDTGEEYWSGPVLNASASGFFIETGHSIPIGTRLTLMPQAEDNRVPFQVQGTVVRVNELNLDENWDRIPGIAFRLDGMSDDAQARLDAFLREHGEVVE
jgi:hypothetical protein